MTGAPRNSEQLALRGTTIVEDAGWVAGPYVGKLLADLGAEVVKVEPLTGDPARRIGPFPVGEGQDGGAGAVFIYCNSNKTSVTLDLELASGRALFARLLDTADVLISDRRASDLRRLGLTPDRIAAQWPELIFLSVTPYGLSGEKAEHPAYELDVFHSAGEGRLLPGGLGYHLFPERQPLKAGRFLPDYDAGLAGALAISAALIRRERTGRGDFIELSHQDVEINLGRLNLGAQLNDGMPLSRSHRGYDFGGIFECRDGYVVFRPNEDRHWRALAEAIGTPGLAEDPRFATRTARHNHGPELNQVILDWVKDRTVDEIYTTVGQLGAPVGFFSDAAGVMASPQTRARGYVQRLPLGGAEIDYPTVGYSMSKTPWRLRKGVPALGGDNRTVYQGIGLSSQELTVLREAAVI